MRLVFKSVASIIKFVQPRLSTNILNVADKRISRLHERELVSLSVAVAPSMFEENIDVEPMFSAIILRTGVKTMDP